ncbi:hypothetical protein F5888DRAFT_1691604 [Russula emetica]|nr:hypothetical protein F5888DRAFT_1691604 [Russula emetica]
MPGMFGVFWVFVPVRRAKVMRQPFGPIPPTGTAFFLTFDGRLRYVSRTALDQIFYIRYTLGGSRVHRNRMTEDKGSSWPT